MRLRTGLLLAALAVSVAGVSPARADDRGITVTGTGEAKARPTSVELSSVVAAEAELTADANVKFKDARKKAIAALDGLKMPNLSVHGSGMTISVAVDPSAANRGIGGNAPAAPSKTRVAEDIKLVLSGTDKMKPEEVTDAILKLIDTGRDAGLTVGPKSPTNYYEFQMMAQTGSGGPAIAQYRLDDATDVREKATQAAMKDARQRAEKLAALAGVKLGPVLTVREGSDPTTTNMRQMIYAMANGETPAVPTATSPRPEDISVKVTVNVQFEISK